MKKICIFNIKGGVGKTTTSVNLAAGLARKGKKVLLLDMDAQGNINTCLNSNESIKDMFHLIGNGAELNECLTRMGHNLDLVTSKETLNDIDKELEGRANKEFMLSNKLEKLKDYDYVIMDCPPHLGTMTKNALFFCDDVFVPVSTDILGYNGAKKTVELINELNKKLYDQEIKITKIIPTFFDKRLNLSKKIYNKLQEDFYGIISDPIRTNSKLREAPKKKRSIFTYAKNSPGAKDYGKLVEEVLHLKTFDMENQEPFAAEKKNEYIEMESAATEIMNTR